MEISDLYCGWDHSLASRTEGNISRAFGSPAKAAGYLALAPDGSLYAKASILAINATINWQTGKNELAYEQAQEVLELTKNMLGQSHPVVNYIQVDQAVRMFKAGEYEKAEAFLREGIASARKAYGRQPRTANALSILGSQLLQRKIKRKEARALLAESLEIMTETLGPDHKRTKEIAAIFSQTDCIPRPPALFRHRLGRFFATTHITIRELRLVSSKGPTRHVDRLKLLSYDSRGIPRFRACLRNQARVSSGRGICDVGWQPIAQPYHA